jgi:hypothetical protein
MWSWGKYVRQETPPEFQQLLTDTFGVNDYGEPLYRIIWGQDPQHVRRVSKPGGGYEDQVLGGNVAGWLLQRWMSPAKWGSPKLFALVNRDPANGQLLFPYPEFGEYETLKNLGGAPLDFEIVNQTVPFLEAVSRLTDMQMLAWKDRQKELESRRDIDMITDRLMDALPTRYGPVSYGRGGCRTSLLDRKMHQIQEVWNRVDLRTLAPKGISQAKRRNTGE